MMNRLLSTVALGFERLIMGIGDIFEYGVLAIFGESDRIRIFDWTKEDEQEAEAQGWNLFWNGDAGREGRTVMLCAEFETGQFVSDDEVWVHVVTQARAGDRLAMKALGILSEKSPLEFADIVQHADRILAEETREEMPVQFDEAA